jgi:hypothetical protein
MAPILREAGVAYVDYGFAESVPHDSSDDSELFEATIDLCMDELRPLLLGMDYHLQVQLDQHKQLLG